MNTLRNRTSLIIAGCALAFLVSSSRAASPTDLSSGDWSVSSPNNLAHNPPTKEAVGSFIDKLAPNVCHGDGPPSEREVASFAFADLRHSGNLSLLVGRDCASREFFRFGYIIDKTASGFEMYESIGNFSAAGTGAYASSLVQDLNDDGNFELVINTDLTGYAGAWHCVATWPVVYAWTGTSYTDVSDRFNAYYRDRLDALTQQIAKLPPSVETDPPPRLGDPGSQDDCFRAEAAKIQRVLGISPNAGLEQAVAWSRNKDKYTRIFAAQILADIGTPEALKPLRDLTADLNSVVAESAKGRLSKALAGSLAQSRAPKAFTRIDVTGTN